MNQVTTYSSDDICDAVQKARQMEPGIEFRMTMICPGIFVIDAEVECFPKNQLGVVSNDVFTCTKLLINKNGGA